MRKFIKTMLLSALLSVPLVANAQSASSLTVANGSSTDSYLPFYGYYMDVAQRTQTIYYDSLLNDMRGNYIHKLTYYASSSSASYTSTITVSMGITPSNSLTTTFDTTTLTSVWSGNIVVADGMLEIELDSAFEYPSDGGNLLIQFQQTSGGNYTSLAFYGISASGNGLRQYGSNSNVLENFMPKLTFIHSGNATYCRGVSNLIASPTSDASGLVSWVPVGTATSWNVFLSDSVITDFTNVAGTSTTDTFYTFSGLTANTLYYVYVQSDCGSDGTSPWMGPAAFATLCDGTALPVPQMYDFENVAHGDLPQCWSAIMSGSSSSSTFPSVYSYNYNARSGNNYFEFESSTGQEEIVRMANCDATNPIMLSFYGYIYDGYSPQSFIVGYYGSDNTFEPVDTLTLSTGYSYPEQPVEVMFSDVTETVIAPAIRVVGNGSSQYTIFIDDLQVKEIPACPAPYNFHALNVAGTQLDLQWIDSTQADSWIVVYDTVPITDFDNVVGTTVYEDSITVNNLEYNTMYYFYMQSECANGGNSEWVGPIAVATQACDNGCYYHVSLEDSFGDGWNGGYLSYTLNGVLQGSTFTIDNGYSSTDSMYVCPSMTLELIYTAGSYSSENSFTLNNMMNEPLYSCADGSTLTSGSACYTNTTSCSSDCPSVNQLMVTEINPTSLEISWNERGEATQWNVVCSPTPVTNFAAQTFEVATSTTYTINNLDTLTYYYIYVQADCGSDSSLWTMIQGRTSQCEGACELTVQCVSTYSYGDSWSYGYASINVMQNGYLLETLSNTGNVIVCPGDSVYFVYSSTYDYYDVNNTWTIYDRFQNPLTNTISNNFDTIAVFTDCQAPSCPRPLQFAFAGTSSGTQSLTWTEMGDATSWNVAYGTEPMDSTASNMTIVAVTDTTFVTITGLSDDSIYYYYVQADCGGDESDWTGPISGRPNVYVMAANSNTSIYQCGGHIYDDGGADGNYSNSQNTYLTIYPTDSTMGVSVTGTQWTESGSFDYLIIYDGTSNAGTVLFSSQGADASYTNGLSVSAASLHGPLTIQFTTDGSVNYPGFDLAVSCFDMTCPAVDSLLITNVTSSSISLDWVGAENVNNFIVKWSTSPFTFESTAVDSMVVSTDSIDITGLNANTIYYLGVASDCGTSVSNAITLNQRTACGDMTLPYIEGFEAYSYNSFPTCWTNHQGTSYVTTSYPASGSNSLQFIGNGIIISPRINLPGNQIQLSCALRAESTTSSGTMHIGFTTDPVNLSDYVEIQTCTPITSYVNYSEIIFNSASADTGYVVFKQDPSASSIYYWWLDNVLIEAVPACPSVGNVTATAIDTTSISLSWVERGTATSWTVEYGLHGFTAGTGNFNTVTDTTFTATGLNPGTDYDFIIKPVCTDSIPDYVYTFSTYTIPISVPFFFDFSDPAQATSWTRQNGANGWYIGELNGDTVLYVSSDNGATNGYNGSAASISLAYVDVMLAANEYAYSFNWLANGEGNYDFIRVALIPQGTDLSGLTYSSVSTTTLPSGWIALDGGNELNQQSSWQTYGGEVLVPTAGGYHIAFIWRNDGSVGNNPAGAIDDFGFQVNSCPVVSNVHASSIGTTEIEVDWTDIASTSLGYQIEYDTAGHTFGTGTFLNATTHPVLISGLDPITNYDFYVRTICAAGDTSRWSDVATLGTTFCDNANAMTTGASNSTNSYVPVNNYFEYSLTQTIISAEELEDVSEISAISYLLTGTNSSSGMDSVTIWLQPSGKTEFTSATDMVTLDTNIAVQVYSGDLNCTPGWNLFVFDNPFTWTGDSASLLVIVDNNTGDYTSSFYYGSVTDTLYRSICWYGDGNDVNPLDPGSWTGYSQYYYMARPAMQLISCGAGNSCRKPSGLNAINVDYGNATITWSAVGTDYEIAVKAETDGVWPEATAITVSGTNASYQLTGLSANTTYQYRVRQVCDATTGEVSDWVTGSFTTAELPCFAPEGYSVTATTVSEATISWPEATDATSFEIHVWNTVYDSVYAVNGTPATIGGLAQTITYNAAVRSVCGYGAEMSEYGDTIQFTTLTCETPTDAAASNVTNNGATISWNGDADTYILEYGMGAFGEGQGTTVEVNSTSYTITGLEPETQYSALVRVKCDAANLSGWSTRVVFTTSGEGIDAVNGLNVNIYPNPTSASTTITLSGVNGEVSISVVDMNGRTVRNATMNCEGDCAHQLEVSNLASGAYFVRISGEGVNSVKRLVVK